MRDHFLANRVLLLGIAISSAITISGASCKSGESNRFSTLSLTIRSIGFTAHRYSAAIYNSQWAAVAVLTSRGDGIDSVTRKSTIHLGEDQWKGLETLASLFPTLGDRYVSSRDQTDGNIHLVISHQRARADSIWVYDYRESNAPPILKSALSMLDSLTYR